MKNLKKLASLALALVLALTMMVPAMAAEAAPGITIENAQKGVTYNVYEIFKMTGGNNSYSYEATKDWEAFFTEGAGASYVTKLDEATDDTNKSFPVNIGDASYYLNLVKEGEDANIVAFAKVAQAYAMALPTPADPNTKTADADGSLKFDLELGYYIVIAYGMSQQSEESIGSLCNLTIAEPNQSIKVKAEKPTITKTAEDGASAVVKGVGDSITFTITGKVPDTSDYAEDTYKYIVSDNMSTGLTFDQEKLNALTVKINGTDVTTACTKTLVGNGFELRIPVEDYQAQIGKDIVVTYTATVNANAIENDTEDNTAKLTYSNDPKSDGTGENDTDDTVEVKVTVYNVQIDVYKYALNAEDFEDHNNALSGAKFALKNADGKYYKYTAADGETPASLEWVDGVANATIATSNAEGKLDIVFKGLSPNVTYKLEEVEAPVGYNKMAADKEITIVPATDTKDTDEGTWVKVSETTEGETTTITYLNTESLGHVEEVMNSTGAELPETGGIGTTIFYTLGALLVIGAGILLITKKRMSVA